ncbi:iron-sulfur cluster-binding protein [Hydrogenobaculum sp.]|nr:MAG: 2-polyprenylphenol hydroxylase [Hydrogenobaculum sp.]PMP62273.1 MAG: 2-polyprenylphenol hydroxylase [Hydrogenobaculum sp.]PMP90595.1 MAG: 2-polyprenylphenol hydroxylase [Hydrogenobaculum sp.]PMP93174.1 MAG: 2-polyprenylphenol hydroxylase [Hydrogenobaculum sp.]HEK25734.1 2-polyprenylphenol hydroxylase [Hydrogenobaculum sp.]
MAEVLEVIDISKSLKLITLKSLYLSKAKPGQFFIMQYQEKPERIPVFIMDADIERNAVSFLLQKSDDMVVTEAFENIKPGQKLHYVEGPAGKPFPQLEYKNILFVSINWGFAGIYNVAKHLKPKNKIDLAFINSDAVHLEDLRSYTGIFDSVYEFDSVEAFSKIDKPYDVVVSAGSNELAKELVSVYEDKNVLCAVITRMLCTVGLCLACRIQYDGKLKLPCVEGPWLEANKIDFDDLNRRHLILKEVLVRSRKS